MTFIEKGIVIKKEKIRENDRIYTIFTKNHGKIEALGKGTSKIISKLSPKLEIFTYSQFMFAYSKIGYLLCQVENLENFNYLRNNFYKYFIASKICYFVDTFTKLQDPEKRVFFLILESFKKLENKTDLNILIEFLIEFTKILGVDLKSKIRKIECKLCKKRTEPFYLDLTKGGIICEECKRRLDYKTIHTPNEKRIFLKLPKKTNQKEIINFIENYLNYEFSL